MGLGFLVPSLDTCRQTWGNHGYMPQCGSHVARAITLREETSGRRSPLSIDGLRMEWHDQAGWISMEVVPPIDGATVLMATLGK